MLALQGASMEGLRPAVLAASADEAPLDVVRIALLGMVSKYASEDMIAIDRIMVSTEGLRARKQASYVQQEQALYSALCERWPQPRRGKALRLVAMVSIGALRLAIEAWRQEGSKRPIRELLQDAFAKPRATPYRDHAHDFSAVIDGEEDSIDMRPASVAEHANGKGRIEALRCNWTSLGMLIEGEDDALEAVEPLGALLRCSTDNPQVQFFELGLRVLRDVNAVCHACGAADRTPAAPASCDQLSHRPAHVESPRSPQRGRAVPAHVREVTQSSCVTGPVQTTTVP